MGKLILPINITDDERARIYAELAQYPDADIDNAEYTMDEESNFLLMLHDKAAKILIMSSSEPQQQPTP